MSIERGREIMMAEADAIKIVSNLIDEHFSQALDAILNTPSGRVVTCGMGKAGIIAQKIAATMASTGTPAFFMHPADALHGDLGMVLENDVMLILSNSGESDEVTRLLPFLRQMNVTIIAVTGNDRSTLAVHSDILLRLGNLEEACPLGLAPSATTTAMLALGDAIALTLMDRRGFQTQDYAKRHPGGSLGRLSQPVENVMRRGESVAAVSPSTSISEVILAITKARSGAAIVTDDKNSVLGIFCDGDLRRGLEGGSDFLSHSVGDVMITGCTRVSKDTLASDVLEMMREKRIGEVPVVDEAGFLVGVADMKGLVASL